jgi:hypothetical protein
MFDRAERFARTALVLALLAVAAGCAGQSEVAAVGPAVMGNERGGKIPKGVDDVPAAMNAVVAHCARFGKKAVITQMATPSEGGLMVFECH